MEEIMKKGVFLILLAVTIVAIAIFFILYNKLGLSAEGKACINSGGEITTASCCGSAGDFPNTCTRGLCGCSPQASHEVKSCSCGEGKCFNGTECVARG